MAKCESHERVRNRWIIINYEWPLYEITKTKNVARKWNASISVIKWILPPRRLQRCHANLRDKRSSTVNDVAEPNPKIDPIKIRNHKLPRLESKS